MPAYEPPQRPSWAQSMRPPPPRHWYSRIRWTRIFLLFVAVAALSAAITFGVTHR